MGMAGAAIEVEGLEKRFGATQALAGATFALQAGAIHGLVGENGAGKSTLIKCLAGLHRLDGGVIRVDGAPARINHPQDARSHGFSFVHQELSLVPYFDAAENAFLGRKHPTRFGVVNRPAMRRAVGHVLRDIAPHLPLDRPVRRLTIGERQIVEIARALIGVPRLIVLDEPTAALGEEEATRLHSIVRRLAASGAAVLYVSHRLGDVLALCTVLTVLRDGATVFDGAASDVDRDRLVRLMSGGRANPLPQRRETAVGSPRPVALCIEGLHVDKGLNPIDLTLQAGDIVGLYGLVGSGRSRLLKTIWGARRPAAGRLTAAGRLLPAGSIAAAKAAGVAYVPEDRRAEGLVLGLSVGKNLSLPALAQVRAAAWFPWPSRRREARFTAHIGQRLAIKFAGAAQPVWALSGGNQQKLLVGRWLRRAPSVLLLDEPTRGVDVRAKADLHAALRDLAAQGTAILFATSDIEELLALSDRIGLMREGRWLGELRGDDRTAEGVLSRLFGTNGP